MKKKKNYRKQLLRKELRQNTVSYVCANCGAEEQIPEDMLEYFDDINPEQLLFSTHEFTWKMQIHCHISIDVLEYK